MNEKFCGVCRHPFPGHHPTCPIVTQEPQIGNPDAEQMAQGMQQLQGNLMAQMGDLNLLKQVEFDEAVAFLCERLKLTTDYLLQTTNGYADFAGFCKQNMDAIEKVAKFGYKRQLEVLRKLPPSVGRKPL